MLSTLVFNDILIRWQAINHGGYCIREHFVTSFLAIDLIYKFIYHAPSLSSQSKQINLFIYYSQYIFQAAAFIELKYDMK